MFKSFFPNPKVFFLSTALWSLFGILLWNFTAKNWGGYIGLADSAAGAPTLIGAASLVTKSQLWFDIYFWVFAIAFGLAWRMISQNKWFNWSMWGSTLLVFLTYFLVQVSVGINDWYGVFFDMIQKALDPATKGSVPIGLFYGSLGDLAGLLLLWILTQIFLSFFTSHYVFRWRTAMNEFYVTNWQNLRTVEGASQRVQEDTMRFATNVEDLGISFVKSIMTLIAFLPVLAAISQEVKVLPIIGEIPYSLVWVSLIWSIFGTGLLAIIGVKLPGLEFKNQRVEAAYRKELVYGEDNASRADAPTLGTLFENVRKNYFRLYFNYLYFNFGRYLYLQADAIVPFLVLIPSVAAGTITLGIFQRARTAMGEARDAMQYLVNSWPQIIELISIYKRLRAFEAVLDGVPLGSIEQETFKEPLPGTQ
jgi:peptide/bleomycin uptake transporter